MAEWLRLLQKWMHKYEFEPWPSHLFIQSNRDAETSVQKNNIIIIFSRPGNYSIIKLIKTQFASISISWHLRKKLCQIKMPDRDSNLQNQKVQLLQEPIGNKKVRFITCSLNHSATQCHNHSERKGYSTFIPKNEGIVARVNNGAIMVCACLVPCLLEDKCLKLCLH